MIKLILNIALTICMICVFEGMCKVCQKFHIKATIIRLLKTLKRANQTAKGLTTI